MNLLNIEKALKNTDSEIEKIKELIPVEITLDNSEYETNNIASKKETIPDSSFFSDFLTKTLCALIQSPNSLSIKAKPSGASFLGVRSQPLGDDEVKRDANVYDLTPEKQKALSSTGYTGKNLKK